MELQLHTLDLDFSKEFSSGTPLGELVGSINLCLHLQGGNRESFNTGDYINSVINRQRAETISNVLYPDDRSYQVMRIVVDDAHLEWSRAWEIACKMFSLTTHTVVPEVLTKISIDLLESLLPWHLQIIYDINSLFVEALKKYFGLDYSRFSRMSIVEKGAVKSIRMANLSIVCCHTVNGVSRIHLELLKTRVFQDFYELRPTKFRFTTNGATQRRWIVVSSPTLCGLISKWLGTEAWVRDVDLLTGLREHAGNAQLQQEWNMISRVNKIRLSQYIEAMNEIKVSPDAMFDVQVMRIHEYKRQFLNILGIIYRYDCIKNMDTGDRVNVVPRVCIIGGKAAPDYEAAIKIINLCHSVAEKVNNDPDVGELLQLVSFQIIMFQSQS